MDVFVALAEPTRREILDLLAVRERYAGEVVSAFPLLTQPAISHHLRILRECGLVSVRTDAQHRIYTLEPDGLVEIETWLEAYRHFWAQRLDALEEHLARTPNLTEPPKITIPGPEEATE